MEVPAMSLERARIQRRRRAVLRVGLLGLLLASSAACIFDRGDYHGGGRKDQGATQNVGTATATESATVTSTSTAKKDSGYDGS